MAGSGLLEREIEKITGETQNQNERESAEELEHRQRMGEKLRDIIERRVTYTPDRSENDYYGGTPAYQYTDYAVDHTPAVPNSPAAPSASDRIADYLAANRNLEEMRARSGQVMPDYPEGVKPDTFERAYEQVFNARYPGAPVAENTGYYETTDEEELYRRGIIMNRNFEPPRQRTNVNDFGTSYVLEEDVTADSLPTDETMSYLGAPAEEQRAPEMNIALMNPAVSKPQMEDERMDEPIERTPLGLSAKTKVILAALAATIAILIAIISINTAVLNSVRASNREYETQVSELSETLTGIESEISDLTSPENVQNWASLHGMIPPEQ